MSTRHIPTRYNAAHGRDDRWLTTGQAAWAVGVAPRTLAKWVDNGTLRGCRLPGSWDRRVETASVVELLKKLGRPVPPELAACCPGVCLGVGLNGTAGPLAAALGAGWRVADCSSAFAAGVACGRDRPAAVVVDVGHVGRSAACALAADPAAEGVRLVALGCGDDGSEAAALAACGYAVCSTAEEAATAVRA